jgi:hypothetical protein
MKSAIAECALLLMVVAVSAEPAFARSYLTCLAKKVIIVDAPKGSTSSGIEESFGLWIDEATKTLVLADGAPLTVRRFDRTGSAPFSAMCLMSSIVKMGV